MDLLVFFSFCLIFYVGYLTGEAFTFFKIRQVLKQLGDAIGVDLIKELNKLHEEYKSVEEKVQLVKFHKLKTEKHGDMIYLFDHERDDFICQGRTIEELAKLAKENKQIVGAIVSHDDKVFVFTDGKSQEYNGQ